MRDELGRYLKGHSGGPGRPKRKTEEHRLAELSDALSDADWREVCKAAIKQAKEGDRHAREWLSKHLLPIPSPNPEPNGPRLDGDEMESLYREYRSQPDYIEYLRWKAGRDDD